MLRGSRWLLLVLAGALGWFFGHGALDVKTKAFQDVGGKVRHADGAFTAIGAMHINAALLRRAFGLAHFTQHRRFVQTLNRVPRITPAVQAKLYAKLERLGHRAGDIKRYPKNFSTPASLRKENRVVHILDRVFAQLDFSGLEIDVKMLFHTPPHHTAEEKKLFATIKGQVYVTHDVIKLTRNRDCQLPGVCLRKQIKALRGSRLKVVVGHFFKRGYPLRGKRLFLELKVGGGLGNKDVRKSGKELGSICQTLGEVESSVQAHTKDPTVRQKLRDSISFASFSFEGLQHLATGQCPQITYARGYEYYWIWGINYTANWHGRRAQLPKARWLTGLWFEPSFFGSGSIKHFNQLNGAREKAGRTPLRIYLSSYFFSYPTQISLLTSALEKSGGVGMKHVKGIIYDIKVK